jgi:hypothetical protein
MQVLAMKQVRWECCPHLPSGVHQVTVKQCSNTELHNPMLHAEGCKLPVTRVHTLVFAGPLPLLRLWRPAQGESDAGL